MRRLVSALLICLFAMPLIAQRDTRSANQLLIVSATADYRTGKLYVSGFNFGSGTPAVKLNGMPLEVLAPTATAIIAALPAQTLLPGSYLLTIASGPSATESDAFSLTIGAAGPQGEKGATGTTGPQGPKGEKGDQGAPGAAGPMGLQGLIGPQCPAGPAGSANASITCSNENEVLKWNSVRRAFLCASVNAPVGDFMEFTSTGTFTVPSGITKISIDAVGGGGGGSQGDFTTFASGGSGCWASGVTLTVTPQAVLAVTVGLGGAENKSGSSTAIADGSTTLLSLAGGNGASDAKTPGAAQSGCSSTAGSLSNASLGLMIGGGVTPFAPYGGGGVGVGTGPWDVSGHSGYVRIHW